MSRKDILRKEITVYKSVQKDSYKINRGLAIKDNESTVISVHSISVLPMMLLKELTIRNIYYFAYVD